MSPTATRAYSGAALPPRFYPVDAWEDGTPFTLPWAITGPMAPPSRRELSLIRQHATNEADRCDHLTSQRQIIPHTAR